MRKVLSLTGLLSGVALSLAAGYAVAAGIDVQDFQQIERGRYLTIVGDCAACHTLPGSGHDLAGGRAIETPFGALIAPNITPDPLTGIGTWTDEEFINSLTKGTGRDGTHLFPAMPYTYYTKVTRDDALAIRLARIRGSARRLTFTAGLGTIQSWHFVGFGEQAAAT